MKRYARDDAGVAVVAVMGAIALLTILSVGAFSLGSQALHEAQLATARQTAFTTAEGGASVAVGKIEYLVNSNQAIPSVLDVVGDLNGSRYTARVSSQVGTTTLTLVAAGFGPEGIVETITADIVIQPAGRAPVGPWGYMLTNGSFNSGQTWQGGVHGKLAVRYPSTSLGTALLGNSNNANSDIGWQQADVYLWNAQKITWGKVNQSGNTLVPVHTNRLPVTQDGWKVLGAPPVLDLPTAPALPVMNYPNYSSTAIWRYTGDLTFGQNNIGTAGSNFFYNGTTGVLTLNGTIYVDGAIIFDKPKSATKIVYNGNGTIATATGHQIEMKINVEPNTVGPTLDGTHVLGFATDTFIKVWPPATAVYGAFYAGQYITVPTPGKVVGTVIAGANGNPPSSSSPWGIVAYDNSKTKKGELADLILDDLDWNLYLPAGMPRTSATSSTELSATAYLSNWRRL